MDLKSIICLILSTLATLHVSIAEDGSLVDGSKSALSEDEQGPNGDSRLSAADKRKWSNFHSWGKRWGNFGTWGKRWASSEFPTWGKRWGSGTAFTSWGKRDATPEQQKRNWNQFITWGKRNQHAKNSVDERDQGLPEKKWNGLSTWGKRSGWDSGFASWGKRGGTQIRDKLVHLFDQNGDGVLDTKELTIFLNWMSSLENEVPQH